MKTIEIQKYRKLAWIYIQRLNDIRFVGQVVFAVVVLLVTWSGIKSVETNYGLQKQISGIQQQNDLQQLQNTNLKLQNEYYNSQQYLELSARQNFGLAVAGEKEIVVPKSVALAHTVELPTPDAEKVSPPTSGSQQNIQAWLNFFLHHTTTNN